MPQFLLLGVGFAELIFLALFLGILALWIWVLVDCIKNEPVERGNDRIVWILVILLAGIIGAMLYLGIRRPTRIQKFGS
jgi:hypothetical protein